jgi:hypothetical protein
VLLELDIRANQPNSQMVKQSHVNTIDVVVNFLNAMSLGGNLWKLREIGLQYDWGLNDRITCSK